MEFVKLEILGHIGVITLNRPPVNSITRQFYLEMGDTFIQVQRDKDIWVVVLKAEGKYFSVGNEMSEFSMFGEDFLNDVKHCTRNIAMLQKPVVCGVQGACVGTALAIVSFADILIASKEAYFVMGETNVGLIGVNFEASNAVPIQALRYMALTGDRLSADDAYRYGMVFEIVDKAALSERVLEIAGKIELKPPIAVRESKKSMQHIVKIHELFDVGAEQDYTTNQYYLSKTNDFEEAYKSFLEKRPPHFTAT